MDRRIKGGIWNKMLKDDLRTLSLEYLGHDSGQGGAEGLALVRRVLQVLDRDNRMSSSKLDSTR